MQKKTNVSMEENYSVVVFTCRRICYHVILLKCDSSLLVESMVGCFRLLAFHRADNAKFNYCRPKLINPFNAFTGTLESLFGFL